MSQRHVGVRGKVISAQSREVIANVLKFMKKEALRGAPIIPLNNYKQRLMEATGVSDRVYRQVLKELELIESGKQPGFTAPTRGGKPIGMLQVVDGVDSQGTE